MEFIKDYLTKKDDYEEAAGLMGHAVRRVFAAYVKQKHEVSTRPYKPWTQWHVEDYTVHNKMTTLHLYYSGLYGYSERKVLSLPTKLVQMVAEKDDEALHAAIAEIIKAEGEDIARREARQAEERAAHAQAEEDAVLAKAAGILAKRGE